LAGITRKSSKQLIWSLEERMFPGHYPLSVVEIMFTFWGSVFIFREGEEITIQTDPLNKVIPCYCVFILSAVKRGEPLSIKETTVTLPDAVYYKF
jgi:hypothetical protein